MTKHHYGLKSMFAITPIILLVMILAAPTAMAEKEKSGHVMHDYAAMEWPFHNDSVQSDADTDTKEAHSKDVKKEKKVRAKNVKQEKQKEADKSALHEYADMGWPFS